MRRIMWRLSQDLLSWLLPYKRVPLGNQGMLLHLRDAEKPGALSN